MLGTIGHIRVGHPKWKFRQLCQNIVKIQSKKNLVSPILFDFHKFIANILSTIVGKTTRAKGSEFQEINRQNMMADTLSVVYQMYTDL